MARPGSPDEARGNVTPKELKENLRQARHASLPSQLLPNVNIGDLLGDDFDLFRHHELTWSAWSLWSLDGQQLANAGKLAYGMQVALFAPSSRRSA